VQNQLAERNAFANVGPRASIEWVRHVINLLDAAVRQLRADEPVVHGTILEATSVLRRQVELGTMRGTSAGRGRLLAWQVRKVREFVEARISGPILVSDLCALVQLSEAHFSRSFKRTFGESPHAFVIRRRVESAAECMLQTNATLSDIAQRFGFTDQAHLCKQFRHATGQTPAAWRRAQRSDRDTDRIRGISHTEAAMYAGRPEQASGGSDARGLRPSATSFGSRIRTRLDQSITELA